MRMLSAKVSACPPQNVSRRYGPDRSEKQPMVAEVDVEETSWTTEGPSDPQTGLAYGWTGSS